jgi:hypothetical protein
MCTVTFVPVPSGFFLTSNRDERTDRGKVEWPSEKNFPGYRLIYPRDPAGNGSWIAADNQHRYVCLLNGAFIPHPVKAKYRHSRGLVVLDVFSFTDIDEFYDHYNLEDIEPFTIVIFWKDRLYELRWDGNKKYLKELPADKPRIWSSVTLYNPDMISLRESWFGEWLSQNPEIDEKIILSFHQHDGFGNRETAINMSRKEVQTISITRIIVQDRSARIVYRDLLSHSDSMIEVPDRIISI